MRRFGERLRHAWYCLLAPLERKMHARPPVPDWRTDLTPDHEKQAALEKSQQLNQLVHAMRLELQTMAHEYGAKITGHG